MTIKRAVLYARVSGDDRGKEGRNLESQLEMGREYATNNGYTVIAELPEDDKGASGADFDLPMLTRAREMAEAKEYDILIVREIDRFARGLAKQMIVEEELKRAGVEVKYVLGDYPDTPEGNLSKQIRGAVSEFERLKIRERLVRGKRNVTRRGSVNVARRPPYGYKVVETVVESITNDAGEVKEVKRRKLAIHEPEARIVRLIFNWYTEPEGVPISIGGIARKLTEMGVPTPSENNRLKGGNTGKLKISPEAVIKPDEQQPRPAGEWRRAVIHNMLRNETYIGKWYYGKKTIIKKTKSNTKNRFVTNPFSSWIPVEVPALIDCETWQAVQGRLANNRRNTWKQPAENYLLRHRLTCGDCGSALRCQSARGKQQKHYGYYACMTRRDPVKSSHICSSRSFRSDYVDALVWDWIEGILSDPAKFEKAAAELQADGQRETAPLRDRLSITEDLLSDYQGQLSRVLDLYIRGDFDKNVLIDRKTRLEETVKRLTKERDEMTAHLEQQLAGDEKVRQAFEFAKGQAENVKRATKDFAVRRGLIEDLQVNVTLVTESQEKVVYARCVIGETRLPIPSEAGKAFCPATVSMIVRGGQIYLRLIDCNSYANLFTRPGGYA